MIADTHRMRAGILAAVLLHHRLELHGRHDVLAARVEPAVWAAFLEAAAKLANHMLHVLDGRRLALADYDEVLRAIGPPFVQVAAVEVVDAAERQETRRLKGPLAAHTPSYKTKRCAQEQVEAPLHLSPEDAILDDYAATICLPAADDTARTIDDAAPVEELVPERPSRLRAKSPGGPMLPATHVLWEGKHALCADTRLQGAPLNWPVGQHGIALENIVDARRLPAEECTTCWQAAIYLQQIEGAQ